MRQFLVEAIPLPRGGWALEVADIGVSQVSWLKQAAEEMRGAIVAVTGLDSSQFTITVRPRFDSQTEKSLPPVGEPA